MKPLNTILLTLTLTLCLGWDARASSTVDSLIIQFANRTKVVIYAPDRAGIQKILKYDLNKMVRDMGMKLDSVPNGQTSITIDSREGKRYLQDSALILKDTLLIITRGKQEGGGDVRIVYRSDQKTSKDSARTAREYRTDRLHKQSSKSDWGVKTDFLLGLNTLVTPAGTPVYDPGQYELRPIGSRFFGISFGQRPTLIKGKNARLSLHYALEVNWNNFMFDNNVTLRRAATLQSPERIEFVQIPQSVEKTKLTIANLQLPVVPRLTFYNQNGQRVAHLGLGGFVGYRIDSYSMIKYGRRDKVRDHDQFLQNDLRYGLMAHLGILRTNFFIKYDLNPIFQVNKGPNVRALSFGLSL